MPGFWRIAAECLLASIGLGVLTFAAFRVHATTATAALLFFFFIVLISLCGRVATSLYGCILSVLCFNYFFAPPIFDLRVHEPRDTALVIAFSSTGLFISLLVSRVRKRTAELTQTNEKLCRSEERLLDAQRLSHTGSWQRDVVSGVVTVSPEIHQIWGSSPNEGFSNAEFWINRIHPEDRKAARELFEKTTTQKTDYLADYRIVLPAGTIKHLHVIGHPVLNESGDLVEFVGTSMDVTEAKQAEAKIRQSERELRQLLDLSPLHITEFGPDGSPLYNNKAALDYHGLTLEEWQSADLHTLLHPQDAERAASEGPGKFRSGSPYEMEVRLRRKDGQYRWFLFRFNPIRDEQGSLTRWYAAATDIEDRKEAEQRLRNENVALREEIDKASMFEEIIGTSPVLQAVLSRVSKVAPTDRRSVKRERRAHYNKTKHMAFHPLEFQSSSPAITFRVGL